jgi:hypothetical protein
MLFMCFVGCLHIVAMQEFIQQLPELNAQNLEFYEKKVTKLVKQDQRNYKKLALLTHPDKHCGNPGKQILMEAIFKKLSDIGGNNSVDKNMQEKQNKLDQMITFLKEYSIRKVALLHALKSAGEEVKKSVISKIVRTFFALLSDRYIMVRYPEDGRERKNLKSWHDALDNVKFHHEQRKIESKMYEQHMSRLEIHKVSLDKQIHRKLEKHIKLEHVCI